NCKGAHRPLSGFRPADCAGFRADATILPGGSMASGGSSKAGGWVAGILGVLLWINAANHQSQTTPAHPVQTAPASRTITGSTGTAERATAPNTRGRYGLQAPTRMASTTITIVLAANDPSRRGLRAPASG